MNRTILGFNIFYLDPGGAYHSFQDPQLTSEWELIRLAGRIPYGYPHTVEAPTQYNYSNFWSNFTYGHS